MKRSNFYEVTLENKQGTEFKEIFGFAPSCVHIAEALNNTALALLESAESETDPLDKDKLLDEANEFDLLKQLIPILDDAYVDEAINKPNVVLAVAGTPVGVLTIVVRSMLTEDDPQDGNCVAIPHNSDLSGRFIS